MSFSKLFLEICTFLNLFNDVHLRQIHCLRKKEQITLLKMNNKYEMDEEIKELLNILPLVCAKKLFQVRRKITPLLREVK